MKSVLLLPNKFKKAGWLVLALTTLIFIIYLITDYGNPIRVKVFALLNTYILSDDKQPFFTFIKTDISFTLFCSLYLIGGILVAFSREKEEDEYIASLRLNAFLWALIINYLILLFTLLFIYGIAFLYIMTANMFTILFIFILRFHYLLLKSKKSAFHEK